MAPKELLALRLLIENRRGLYASEFVHKSEDFLTRGTIYTLLERMVNKGFVREVEEPATAALQLARTRHLITAQGRAAYEGFLTQQRLQMVSFATAGV